MPRVSASADGPATRIVLYTDVDAQCDKMATVDRTSTVARTVRSTEDSQQFVTISIHLYRTKYADNACDGRHAATKLSPYMLGQSSRGKYPHFGDSRISL